MAFILAVVIMAASMSPVMPMLVTLVKPLVMMPMVAMPMVVMPMVVMPMVVVPMVGASIEEKRVINNQRENTKEEPGGQE